MTRLSRSLSTLIVIAMMLTITAVPALAVAVGNASITSPDLLSGQGGSFTVRIANNGVSGGSIPLVGGDGDGEINAFVIEVPGSVFDAQAAQLPAGWSGEYDADIGFVFATADDADSALSPGSSLDVTVTGSATLIPDDRTANVPVFVSDDGGMTLSSAGTPPLTSRILRLDQVRVLKPGAVNGNPLEVTEEQDTADVRVRVTNFGSQSRSVTLDAAGASGTSSVTVDDAPAVTVAGNGGTGQIVADATFGSAGSLVIEATATTTQSAAQPITTDQIAVQDAFDATYVGDTLAPSTVVQGDSVTFELDVNKTGVQPADLSATFSSAAIGLSANGSPSFPANGATTKVTFNAVTIPNVASDSYETSARLSGVDHNGAKVDVTVTPDLLTLDDLVPYVDVDVDLPPTTVAGATEAASSDTTIDISGEAGNDAADGAGGDPCTDCTIDANVLVYSNVNGTGSPLTTIPFDLANNNGDLSASRSFDFPDTALSARVRVKATKSNGRSATALSDLFEVDVIAPKLVSAVTGRDDAGDYINVFISELVNATGVNPSDFDVDNNAVVMVNSLPQDNGATLFELRLATELGDNDTPSVNYQPGTLLSQRPVDRVGKTVADKLLESIDGIVPEAPVIQTVNGLGLQDGAYWSNVRNATVTLAGMSAGDTLFLYFETDGDGIPENGEKIFQGSVDAATATIQLGATALPATDTNGTLIARMFDDVGFGELDSDPLNVDFTVPEITTFVQDGNTVTVNFNEPLARGRDAAFDWTVTAVQDGTTASRTVTAVAGSGDSRQLTVSSSSYDPARGDVTGVRFKYRGPASSRYDDRATNPLANQVGTTTG